MNSNSLPNGNGVSPSSAPSGQKSPIPANSAAALAAQKSPIQTGPNPPFNPTIRPIQNFKTPLQNPNVQPISRNISNPSGQNSTLNSQNPQQKTNPAAAFRPAQQPQQPSLHPQPTPHGTQFQSTGQKPQAPGFNIAPSAQKAPSQNPYPQNNPPQSLPPQNGNLNLPAHKLPPSNIPSQNLQSSNVPSHNMPPSNIPPHNRPPSNIPPHNMPPSNIPQHNMPPSNIPPQNIPPSNIPPHNIPPSSIPPHNMPTSNIPPHNIPPYNIPPHNMPLSNIPYQNPSTGFSNNNLQSSQSNSHLNPSNFSRSNNSSIPTSSNNSTSSSTMPSPNVPANVVQDFNLLSIKNNRSKRAYPTMNQLQSPVSNQQPPVGMPPGQVGPGYPQQRPIQGFNSSQSPQNVAVPNSGFSQYPQSGYPQQGAIPQPGYGHGTQPGYPGNNQFPQPGVSQGGQYNDSVASAPPHPGPAFGGAGVPSFGGAAPSFMGAQQPGQAGHLPQRPKIDPDQIPGPVDVHAADQRMYDLQPYQTYSRTCPPLAATTFKNIDEGICSPRFFRLTTYMMPSTEEILNMSMVPIAAIVTPLADVPGDELPVQVVDFGEAGPLRCRRCRAYVNPGFMFSDGGRIAICNLCRCETEVPPEYFCNLEINGRRMDLGQRPELLFGAIEFKASKEYSLRPAVPASFLFGIDVSWNSLQHGVLALTCKAMHNLLYMSGGFPAGCSVGIFTYDRAVHFYNLDASLSQPHELTVSDLDDMFLPLKKGVFVDPIASRNVIESLLMNLPNLFEGNRNGDSVLGAASQAALLALKDYGGKVFLFQSCLPTVGPGALKMREDVKLLGSDKEKQLFEPQEYFWKKTAEEFVKYGICCDMFIFPHSYVDVASIGSLSSTTGGDLYVYQNFDASKDGIRFIEDVCRNGKKTFGFEGLMRVRCSDGVSVAHYFGNMHQKSGNLLDVEFGGISSDKSIGVLFRHERKLDENIQTAFQVALLYTTSQGERRIRVLNMSIPNTAIIANLFKYSDMDTVVNYFAKACVLQAGNGTLKSIREQLTERCVKILLSYRKNCAQTSSSGQLILPEAFKLFPLYTLSLLKCNAFRAAIIPSDLRIASMRHLKGLSVPGGISFFYPRMFALHKLDPSVQNLIPGWCY